MNIIYHNGAWVDDGPLFSFSDRIRLGDGIFDTMLVIVDEKNKARLVHCTQHFQRLLTDINLLEISPLPSLEDLEKAAQELCEKNKLSPGRYALNTVITRGPAQRGLMPPEDAKPTIAMRLSEVPKEFPPVTAITARRSYRNEGSPLSQIKSCNYGDNILVLIEARNKGANEAIMLNNSGNVTCTTSGNIFVILNNTLYTPPLSDGVFAGITREILIDKFSAVECSISMDDLRQAQGICMTNSIRGCVPITELNGYVVPEPTLKIEQDFHLE